jgi:Ca2+-dependent lipid-binding protein
LVGEEDEHLVCLMSVTMGVESGTPGKLTLTVVRGADLKAMDLNGKSDPYVEVQVRNGAKVGGRRTDILSTEVVKKTLNPVWHKDNTVKDLQVRDTKFDFLEFKVWDKDTLSSDDLMGEGSIMLDEFKIGEKVEKWIPLDTKGRILVEVFIDDPQGIERQKRDAVRKEKKKQSDAMIDAMTKRREDAAADMVAIRGMAAGAKSSLEAHDSESKATAAAAGTGGSGSAAAPPQSGSSGFVGGVVTLDGPSTGSSSSSGMSASDVGHVRTYEEERRRNEQLDTVESVLDAVTQ